MIHRHDHLDESMLRSIERPPDVRCEQVLLVTFVRGEGCCSADVARECTAVYTSDGDLIGVIDPCPRQPKEST